MSEKMTVGNTLLAAGAMLGIAAILAVVAYKSGEGTMILADVPVTSRRGVQGRAVGSLGLLTIAAGVGSLFFVLAAGVTVWIGLKESGKKKEPDEGRFYKDLPYPKD